MRYALPSCRPFTKKVSRPRFSENTAKSASTLSASKIAVSTLAFESVFIRLLGVTVTDQLWGANLMSRRQSLRDRAPYGPHGNGFNARLLDLRSRRRFRWFQQRNSRRLCGRRLLPPASKIAL